MNTQQSRLFTFVLVASLAFLVGYWQGHRDTVDNYRKCQTLNPEGYVCPAWVGER